MAGQMGGKMMTGWTDRLVSWEDYIDTRALTRGGETAMGAESRAPRDSEEAVVLRTLRAMT